MPRATAEVAIAALMFAGLSQAFHPEATDQSTTAFMIVVASSVFLGAFRLRGSRGFLAGIGRELLAAIATIGPAVAVQLWIRSSALSPELRSIGPTIVLIVADLAVFVVGRFLVAGLPWRLRFNRGKLRWQLVHAHIVVVMTVISIPLVLIVFFVFRDTMASVSQPGANPVESVVLRLAYRIIPVLATVIVLFGLALIVVVPPSIALSYVVARRMTRRLEQLARATTAIREGDRSARVEVRGSDEVAELQANFNAMAGVLETSIAEVADERDTISRLLDQRRELVASVSHELRTPLTIIRGYLDSTLAQSSDLSPDLARDLSVMHGEALRLQRLIDDLFALSRAEVGSLTLHPRDSDVAAILRRCAGAAGPAAWRAQRVEVLLEPPGLLPDITVDPDRLEQIVFNLINNAVRHSPPGGLVRLAAARDGDCVQIDVADTGEGIAPDELDRIWERFYRGSNAQDARGSGIGLAVVRELTEAMGGDVLVDSTLGEGARFSLRFPIDRDPLILPEPSAVGAPLKALG